MQCQVLITSFLVGRLRWIVDGIGSLIAVFLVFNANIKSVEEGSLSLALHVDGFLLACNGLLVVCRVASEFRMYAPSKAHQEWSHLLGIDQCRPSNHFLLQILLPFLL